MHTCVCRQKLLQSSPSLTMSLWPPGVVQRLTSQAPPAHISQHTRTPLPGWPAIPQHHQQPVQQQQHHPEQQQQQQQQQLGWLLKQQQQYQFQLLNHQEQWDSLQYVLQQQGIQQQCSYTPRRGLAVVAAAAAAAQPAASAAALPTNSACWPAATYDSIPQVVNMQHEVLQWPQDKQPKLGYITKAKLRKLTAAELRAEVLRLDAPAAPKALKEDLINTLLHHLTHPHTAAAAPAAAASGSSAPAAAMTLTALGAEVLQQVAPSVAQAAAAAAGDGGKLSLQGLMQCQVADLHAALSAFYPVISPTVSLAQQQLLSGSKADLVQKLLLCLATHAEAHQQQQQQQQQPAASKVQQQQQPAVQLQPEGVEESSQQPAASTSSSSSSSHTPQQPQTVAEQPRLQEPPQQQKGSKAEVLSQQAELQQQQVQEQQQPAGDAAGAPKPWLQQGPMVVPGTMPPYDPEEAARIAAAVGVQLEDLPPLAQQSRGHVYDVDWLTEFSEQEKDLVLKANRAGLVLTLVGGAVEGAESGDSSSSCLALLRERDAWLFDVGEDTQRLVMWLDHIRPSKMHRIVVSRQTPDALLGLPGVLCVIGSSREKGHEKADIPVHVFGPEGTCEFLSTMYDCGNTYLEMPVVVHEFVHHAVSEEETAPQPYNSRSKLWRVLLPPDQLNPNGFVDASLENFQPLEGRARVKRGGRAAGGVLAKNPRAGYRPLATPPPGDPARTGLSRSDMTWTIQADEAALLTAVAVEAPDLTWGIVWKEADKQGNLSVPRCLALNINNADLYGVAKTGVSVPNDDGIVIPASMLCTQDKPGRKMVLLPACDSAAALAPYAAEADVMFAHSAAAAGVAAGAPLGAAVGRYAREWGVRALVTTAMPQSVDAQRSYNLEHNAFNPAWRQRRLGKGSSSTSDSDDESSSAAQQQQQDVSARSEASKQPWEQQLSGQDPETAAFLQAVAQEYDGGLLLPGRDFLSLIVEENSGKSAPPPLDMQEKHDEARASTLTVADVAEGGGGRQQYQQQQHRRQSQQQGRPRGSPQGRQQGGWQQQRPGQQHQQRSSGYQQSRQSWQQPRERSVAR